MASMVRSISRCCENPVDHIFDPLPPSATIASCPEYLASISNFKSSIYCRKFSSPLSLFYKISFYKEGLSRYLNIQDLYLRKLPAVVILNVS
jgi:hypothetical protein